VDYKKLIELTIKWWSIKSKFWTIGHKKSISSASDSIVMLLRWWSEFIVEFSVMDRQQAIKPIGYDRVLSFEFYGKKRGGLLATYISILTSESNSWVWWHRVQVAEVCTGKFGLDALSYASTEFVRHFKQKFPRHGSLIRLQLRLVLDFFTCNWNRYWIYWIWVKDQDDQILRVKELLFFGGMKSGMRGS